MTISDVEKVATALLYDGPSHAGVIAPGEGMQTECLVEGDERTTFDVRVRFLQLTPRPVKREVTAPATFAWPPLLGAVDMATVRYADGIIRLRVRIANTSHDPRETMVATHSILRVSGGKFLSMIDPPKIYELLADHCKNIRTWPVLAGARGQHQIMLSSSSIVYDYPEIADES